MAELTPQEMEEILQQFFDVTGKRQYIGARYVPVFGRKNESSIEWDNSAPYEPLTIVLYQGNSYTSRTYVPTGVSITDTYYWANTGNYNAQVEAYRQEVSRYSNEVQEKPFAFDTVEDMQECTLLYAGAICHTNGFRASEDGGAAWYVIDSSTPNGMDVLECGNLAATLLHDGNVVVEQLGAYGDGVHDDTEIIRRGITIATKSLKFIGAKYRITESIILNKNDFALLGTPDKKPILSFELPPFSEVPTNKACIKIQVARNLTIADLTIDGNERAFGRYPQSAYHGIHMLGENDDDVNGVTIRDCHVTGVHDSGIYTSMGIRDTYYPRVRRLTVNGCTLENIGVHGIGLNNTSDVIVNECYFHDVGLKEYLPDLELGSGLGCDVSALCENCIVTNNIVDGAGGGFKSETHVSTSDDVITSRNITFSHNLIRNLNTRTPYFFGIKVNSLNSTVSDNVIEANEEAILIGTYAKCVLVSNNSITITSEFNNAIGLRNDSSLGNIQIKGNVIHGATYFGITSRSDNTIIADNTIYDSTNGIRITNGSAVIISGNLAHDCNGVGIHLSPVSGEVHNAIVSNNISHDNGHGILVAENTETKLIGNVTYDNSIGDIGYNGLYDDICNDHVIAYSNAQPTAGAHKRGDIVLNSFPTSTGIIAWICYASGTPGSWREINA